MRDGCGREIDYIRISVTDRCNLRCTYCMPEEGVNPVDHSQILRYSDIVRICTNAAELGIRKIKLTGGEPLVRRGIVSLVRELKEIPGIEEVTMTTNGVLLDEMYEELVEAGLTSVTISIDTLDRERFAALTRRDQLPAVLKGLEKAVKEGKIPVKVNCVAMKESTAEELVAVAELARRNPVHVRFIEMMPIGMGKGCDAWTEDELIALMEKHFGSVVPAEEHLGNGPAHYVAVDGFAGRIGLISAMTHTFCDRCNRVRITSEGFLKSCLQYDKGVSLRPALAQEDDEILKNAMREGIFMKPKQHSFGRQEDIPDEEFRKMSQIGG